MVDNIVLNGKTYPVCLGFAALREAERETGKGLNEVINNLTHASISDTIYLCYLSLKHGARKEGQDFGLDQDMVADLLDEPGKLTELSELIGEQLGKIFAPPAVVEQI